jgi:acetyl esterase/lipase
MRRVSRMRMTADLLTRGLTHQYGPDRSQRADLRLPRGPGEHPVAVLIHGGSWQARYGRIVMRALAGNLLRRGWATWNIEYRRVGNGGGWPHTFTDVAEAIDHLSNLRAPLDLERVTLIGHSAGGHLALWAASREQLPPGAPGAHDGAPRVRIQRVVSQAGVADLGGAYTRWRGGAVRALMGGGPEEHPERFRAADPMCLLPAGAPALLVHGSADETVSVELSRSYERAARAAGAPVELVEIAGEQGSHRAHIDPRGIAWAAVAERLG